MEREHVQGFTSRDKAVAQSPPDGLHRGFHVCGRFQQHKENLCGLRREAFSKALWEMRLSDGGNTGQELLDAPHTLRRHGVGGCANHPFGAFGDVVLGGHVRLKESR